MDNKAPKCFPYPDWENDPQFVYLGWERNPHTGRLYDYWLRKGKNEEPEFWSATARHGQEASDYGSNPLCVSYYDTSHFGRDLMYDFVWGMERVNLLALYYLATGEMPAFPKNYEQDQATIDLYQKRWNKHLG